MRREQLVQFVQEDYARVRAALSYACGDPGQAEDGLQEALAKACRHRGDIDNPRAWVTRVALNEVRSRARQRGAEQRANERAVRLRTAALDPSSERLDDSVLDELRRLPERQRQIVALHYLLDMAVTDVADALRITDGTVKTQLHRARETLRARLGRERHIKAEEDADHVG